MNRTSMALWGRGLAVVAGLAGLAFVGTTGFAQPSSRSPLAPPPNGPRKSEPGDGLVVFTGVTVHVKPGQTIENGTVVIRGGKIESVAPGVAGGAAPSLPAGAETRDCTGMHLYAGFLEPYFEVDVPKPDLGAPGTHWNPRVTPQRTALDKGASAIPAKDAETLRSMGFVAAAISPKGGIFRGSSAVVSLAQISEDPSAATPRVYADKVYQCVAIDPRDDSEMPRGMGAALGQVGGQRPQRASEDGSWSRYPDSEMGAIALVRQTLSDGDWVASSGAGASEAEALRVLAPSDKGQAARLLCDAADELEVLREIKIADEFKRHADVLGSGLEFRRLEAIVRAARKDGPDAVRFIEPLNFPRAPKVGSVGEQDAVDLKELINWEQAPTNLRRMDAAGLTVALTTSKVPEKLGGRKVFRDHLGTAIKHGLKPERALAMLTTNAAGVLGVSDQLGTIEKGKAASFIVADGDLFTDRPDAPKKGEPGYVRPGRIVDVWIDGRRHPIAPKQRRDLGGTWEVTLEPGPKAGSNVRITYEIDDDFPPAITIIKRSTDEKGKEEKATIKAQGVSIDEDDRFRFSFEHEPFGEKGVFVSAGVIEKDDQGEPVMRAEAIRAGGQVFRWTARRVSKELPKPEKKRERGGKGSTAEGAKDAEKAEPKKDDGKGDAKPEVVAAANAPAEPTKPGETKSEKDSSAAEPPAVKHGEAKTEPVHEKAKGEDGEESGGAKKSKTPEQDAIAQVPEKLGLPLGAYAMDGLPAQGTVVLKGGTVWTSGPRGKIENGVVVLVDGKITAVGGADSVEVKSGDNVRTIDCTGKHITPGIVDCHSHTGISKGVNESGQAVTAEVRIADVTDPDSISWYRQLGAGVTTVNSLHGSANPIGGQNQVNKNRWGCIAPDDMHFAGAMPGIKFALGENVKQSNGDRQSTRYPVTRMGVETLMRDRFTAAKEYAAAMAQTPTAKFKKESDAVMAGGGGLPNVGSLFQGGPVVRRDLELEALTEILEGKRLIHCHSYRQDEILMLCRIADEFGFKIGTFQHGLEVYKVADVVKTHVGPGGGASIFADWWAYKVEVQDAIPYAGPLQTEVGVLTSYNSDSDEMARRLNVEAGKAAKYSHARLSQEEAIKFVTINPARQLKIDDKVGSIEVGKDADIAVWSGPPLSSLSRCERTFVDGREMFSLERDAEMRKANAAERARIIQKVLATAARGEARRGGRGGDDDHGGSGAGAGPGAPGTDARPTDEMTLDEVDEMARTLAGRRSILLEAYRQQDDLRRERYIRLIQQGLDPRFHTAGECGCE